MSQATTTPLQVWDMPSYRKGRNSTSSDNISNPDSAIDLSEERRASFEKSSSKETSPEPRVQKLVSIKLPDLFSSVVAIPARLHPKWNSYVSEEADLWAKQVMRLSDKAFARHQKAQLPLLAAGFVPEADAEGYRIMCDFMEWVFYFDDMFDEGELREDPVAARDELEAHLAIHAAKCPDIDAQEYPIRSMYQTLWRKIQAISSPAAQERYIQGMRHYFEGCITQVDSYYWHTRGYSAVTFDMFWRERTHSVGCRPCQALLEPLYGLRIPEKVWQHPMIKEAEDTATVITFLHNDILSYRKEQAEPEAVPHNTIHVLIRERGLSLQEAFDFAGELLKQAFQRWYWAQQHLPSWGEQIDIDVSRYLTGILDQAKANLHWSFASGRYFGKDSEMARKTMMMDIPIRQ